MELIDPRVEEVSRGEEKATAKVVEITEAFITELYEGSTVRRDAHPKHQGVVKATFTVDVDQVPIDLRWGLFARSAEYKCWVRFSNGSGIVQKDSKPDGRGMAIKIIGVKGERVPGAREKHTQDFTMIDHPVFFIRDAAQYQHFVRYQKARKDTRFFIGWNPCHWHIRQALIVRRIKRTIPSLLVNRYFSMSPRKLGPLNVKYACKSVLEEAGEVPKNPDDDYLRQDMVKRLHAGPVEFDFTVQTRTHADRMPIEEPTRYWSEELSPYRKVARVTIHQQTFDSEAQMRFGENISLTPWNSLMAHAPLGGLNRMRRAVYEAISNLRHKANKAPNPEPTGDEEFNAGPRADGPNADEPRATVPKVE